MNNLHYLWNELTTRPNTKKKQNMILKMIGSHSEMYSFDGAMPLIMIPKLKKGVREKTRMISQSLLKSTFILLSADFFFFSNLFKCFCTLVSTTLF